MPVELVADAGSDKLVEETTTVSLDGRDSSITNDNRLSYEWTQTAGPSVTLSNISSPTPSFTAPEVDTTKTLTFKLAVSGGLKSASDKVNITVEGDGSHDTTETDIDSSDLPGSGTVDDPYVITNASELQAMEDDLDAHYILGDDINASGTATWNNGKGFEPVGSYVNGDLFTGSLKGSNHTISGLTIIRPDTIHVGLIGAGYSTSVKNITLKNAIIVGQINVGGLVGSLDGEVRNAGVEGVVSGDESTGGLVGNNDGTIIKTYTKGSVSGMDTSQYNTPAQPDVVGGLVGENHGSVKKSYSASVVEGDFDGGAYTSPEYVGGLVGLNDGNITDSYAAKTVRGDSLDTTGGLIGKGSTRDKSGEVSNSYWDTTTTGQNTSAGDATGLVTSEMTGDSARTNMPKLEFGTVWRIQSGEYPTLYSLPDQSSSDIQSSPNPTYVVRINSITTPVTVGDSIIVEATITNIDDEEGAPPVRLLFNGVQADSNVLDGLDPGDTRSVQLSAQTDADDIGTLPVSIAVHNANETKLVTVQDSNSKNPKASFNVENPLQAGETDQLEVNASNRPGKSLDYTWYVNGTEINCDSDTCSISVSRFIGSYRSPLNITLVVENSIGKSDREYKNVDISVVDLNVTVNGPTYWGCQECGSSDFSSKSLDLNVLVGDSITATINDSKINHDIVSESYSINTSSEVQSQDSLSFSIAKENVVKISSNIILSTTDGREKRFTRNYTIRSREYESSMEHFTFKSNGLPAGYRLQYAIIQDRLPIIYEGLDQRTRGLPESITVHLSDEQTIASQCDEYAGACAVPPNTVYLPKPLLIYWRPYDTVRHELTHVAQYHAGADTEDQWEFISEGSAQYEHPIVWTSDEIEKPTKSELFNFDRSGSAQQVEHEYTEAIRFVDAFTAKYGRQALWELIQNSQNENFQTEFKRTTGDSFDTFYQEWAPHDHSR
jgi:hypothetical protein